MTTFEKCPVCGSSVKGENLPRHMDKVHPREKQNFHIEAVKGPPPRRSSVLDRRARKRALLWVLVIAGIVATSIAAYSLLRSGPGPQPHIHVSPTFYDFGDIPPELAIAAFTVQSLGEGELVLMSIATSCMCTSAVFLFKGRESPTFGMHGNPEGWSERMRPGDRGELRVTYDPNVHPDSGEVIRAVYIGSNDPANREVQITITANVVRG